VRKDEDFTSTVESIGNPTLIQQRTEDIDVANCVPQEYVSKVGRSIAWHAFQRHIYESPSYTLNKFPDFQSSMTLGHEIESNGVTMVPMVNSFTENELMNTSSIFVVVHSETGEYDYGNISRETIESSPEFALALVPEDDTEHLEFSNSDFQDIFNLLDFAVNCKGLNSQDIELLRGLFCKVKCPKINKGDKDKWVNFWRKIRRFFKLVPRPLGGREDDDTSPSPWNTGTTVGNNSNNSTTNNGTQSDPNLLNNIEELMNCLGYDQFDDNTSPPHPNEAL